MTQMRDDTLGKEILAKYFKLKRFKLKNFQRGPAACKYFRYLYYILCSFNTCVSCGG